MGTRGLFGFCYKGKYYWAYNHWDSYPSGLGADIIKQLQYAIDNHLLDDWKNKIVKLIEVDENVSPTDEEIQQLKKYTNLKVSDQSTDDWYCLLRGTQGCLQSILDAGYIVNHAINNKNEYDADAEYTYTVNLDNNTLDVSWGESYPFDNLPNW